jgi:hypothetical protein
MAQAGHRLDLDGAGKGSKAMGKKLVCGDVVAGCDFVAEAENEAEPPSTPERPTGWRRFPTTSSPK